MKRSLILIIRVFKKNIKIADYKIKYRGRLIYASYSMKDLPRSALFILKDIRDSLQYLIDI
jgi:hypothetical protein